MNKKILMSLIIGVCAGIIDVIPGIIEGVDIRVTLAGFTFWVTTGFIVAHVSLPIKNWLKGVTVASLLAIPGTILISKVDPNSVVPMIILTIFLGALVGLLTGKYAN